MNVRTFKYEFDLPLTGEVSPVAGLEPATYTREEVPREGDLLVTPSGVRVVVTTRIKPCCSDPDHGSEWRTEFRSP